MDVLLVDRRGAEPTSLAEGLRAAGCRVVEHSAGAGPVRGALAEGRGDLIVLSLWAPDLALVSEVCELGRSFARPVVVFVEETDSASTQSAVLAGATAYVVRGDQPDRLRDVLEVAAARFVAGRVLRDELEQMKASLVARKLIERAKGLLMERGNLSERDAYEAMRKVAMQWSCPLVEIATKVIEGSAP